MSNTKKGEYQKQNRSYQDKMYPGDSKSFVDKTYKKLLAKSGRAVKIKNFDAKAALREIAKARPEYKGVFRNPLE